MDGSAFRSIGQALYVMFFMSFITVPLALWKIIDVIIWLCGHISLHWH